MTATRTLDDWATITLFLAVLVAPVLASMGRESGTVSETEARALATTPDWEWNLSALETWPALYEESYNDQFSFRAWILPRYQWFRFKAYGVSPTDRVVVGDDGWLYVSTGIEEFAPLPPALLERFAHDLEERHVWLQERGIGYAFAAVPDKPDVYPEHMPADIQLKKQRSRIDEFCAAMAGLTTASVINLSPALLRAKASHDLFYRNDPHWNSMGAYVGYETLIGALGPQLDGLQPVPVDEFAVSPRTVHGGGLARMMGLGSLMVEQAQQRDPDRVTGYTLDASLESLPGPPPPAYRRAFATTRPDKPFTALVFRDSYTTAMVPFLSETFGRVIYVWERPTTAYLKALVSREQPDVVIEQRVTRFLSHPPTTP